MEPFNKNDLNKIGKMIPYILEGQFIKGSMQDLELKFMPKYKTANECYDLYMAEGGYILVKLKRTLQKSDIPLIS